MQITNNTAVSIHYTLTNQDGEQLDSSIGGDPLVYLHGQGNIIPGLEQALNGRSAGDKFNVSIDPDAAYGAYDNAKVQQIPQDQFAGVDQVEVGMQFHAETSGGLAVVTVIDVQDDTVTIDGNHPLAGQTLNFDVEVAHVRDATPEEIDHGHIHGPGGHAH
ncbi:MAG: peptidylprolyl isomerase [Methylococcales bacterium]|nr:peptidylprolyl isomerase [Methylococcales bacterium]